MIIGFILVLLTVEAKPLREEASKFIGLNWTKVLFCFCGTQGPTSAHFISLPVPRMTADFTFMAYMDLSPIHVPRRMWKSRAGSFLFKKISWKQDTLLVHTQQAWTWTKRHTEDWRLGKLADCLMKRTPLLKWKMILWGITTILTTFWMY